MTIETNPISSYAMCRECAKEFSSKKNNFRAMYVSISRHIKSNPGHVVIGTEQTQIIAKEPVCTAL